MTDRIKKTPNLNQVLTSGNKGDKPILLVDGSSTAPAYSFKNDTDTGIYMDGSTMWLTSDSGIANVGTKSDFIVYNRQIIFTYGSSQSVGMKGSKNFLIGVRNSLNYSNHLMALVDKDLVGVTLETSLLPNPTFRVYSQTTTATNTDEYIQLIHDGTDAVIGTGKGRIKVDSGMRLKHITTTTDYTILESDYIIGGYTNDSYSSDILTDGTMDIWTDSNTLTNWNKDLVGGPGNAILDREGTIKTDGSYSAKITNDSDGTSISLSQEHTGLTSTDTYEFSIDARNGGSGDAVLFFLNSAGDHIWNFTTESWDSYSSPPPTSDQERIITLSSTFANYTANVKPYSDGSLVPYVAGDIGNASTIVYFDNVKLRKITVGTAITLTLPTAVEGATYIIKDESGNASTNTITIATPGTETIDGSASTTIVSNYNSITLYSDGSNWFTV